MFYCRGTLTRRVFTPFADLGSIVGLTEILLTRPSPSPRPPSVPARQPPKTGRSLRGISNIPLCEGHSATYRARQSAYSRVDRF
jgi:hypothetical protein